MPDVAGAPVWILAAALVGGFAAWPFVEYGIHGILAHRFRTFVTPLHMGHHAEPRAVFTSPLAWVPAVVVLGSVAVGLAGVPGAVFVLGVWLGFVRYEVVHWRFHFRMPRSDRERLLRAHHLAHHYGRPDAYHGVTSRFWDRVLGTLPASWPEDYARVAEREPLAGPSNLFAIWSPRSALGVLKRRA
jgi:sterol desaturase/sphingolipid hydroxylase (fatty acid hydroxylase superfamily)